MTQIWSDDVVPSSVNGDAGGWALASVIAYEADYPGQALCGRWWFPPESARPEPIGTIVFKLWDEGSDTLLASATFADTSPGAPVTGTWRNTPPFASPVDVAGLTVAATVITPNGYYPAEGGVFPVDGGTWTAINSRFNTSGGQPDSGGTSTAYFVDLVTGTTGPETHHGTAAITIALTQATAGRKSASGRAALALVLASVVGAGRKRAYGQAHVSLGLATAAAGRKYAYGAAALGLALRLAVAGTRLRPGHPRAAGRLTVRTVASGHPTSTLTASGE